MGILIIEDSAFQARILADLLKPVGSAVFVASNVKEAFEILQTVQISLVVSDLYMPSKEEGMQFLRRLMANKILAKEQPQPEVFVCTIDGEMQTRAELSAIGVRHVFIKPYNANLVLQSVREIFWCAKDGMGGSECSMRSAPGN